MIELVVVVGLIIVMAAIAIPNIAGYTRNYRVRGATQQIASELTTARNKAIVRNTNFGVAFAVVDANSYRFSIIDDDQIPAPAVLGRGWAPLRDLPQGVVFVPAATTPVFGIGFDRLGRRCPPTGGGGLGCPPPQNVASMCTGVTPPPPVDARCTDKLAGSYLDFDAVTGTVTVRVRDEQTLVTRWVSIAPGGRVVTQR
jgi:hypothetical protein